MRCVRAMSLLSLLAGLLQACAGTTGSESTSSSSSSSSGSVTSSSAAGVSSSHALASSAAGASSASEEGASSTETASSAAPASSTETASSSAPASSAEGQSSSSAAVSSSGPIIAPEVPAAIEVPDGGGAPIYKANATGVQIYSCGRNALDGGPGVEDAGSVAAWKFVAPDADLFDDEENMVGHHSAGPRWQLDDGSNVTGAVVARATPDATAIPWLLLSVATNAGAGVLTNARFIQRVDTVGGLQPSDGCTDNTQGTEQRIDYTATYYFFGGP